VSSFITEIYPAAKCLYETAEGLHPLFVTAQAALETGWKIKIYLYVVKKVEKIEIFLRFNKKNP
jgi:hypothetical protein